jgi:hypothetical protein
MLKNSNSTQEYGWNTISQEHLCHHSAFLPASRYGRSTGRHPEVVGRRSTTSAGYFSS